MFSERLIIELLFTCFFTTYIAWSFLNARNNLYQAMIQKKSGLKYISLAFLFLLPLIIIAALIPDYLEEYTLLSMYLFVGLSPWLALNTHIQRKNSLGKLLFKSQSKSKVIYLMIPMTAFTIWAIYKYITILINQTVEPYIIIMFDSGISRNLLYLSQIFIAISVYIYMWIISWHQLEIRDEGIWFIDDIKWQNITNYNWTEEKPDRLTIKYLNGFGRENNSNIKIVLTEKESIDNIFRDKIDLEKHV